MLLSDRTMHVAKNAVQPSLVVFSRRKCPDVPCSQVSVTSPTFLQRVLGTYSDLHCSGTASF